MENNGENFIKSIIAYLCSATGVKRRVCNIIAVCFPHKWQHKANEPTITTGDCTWSRQLKQKSSFDMQPGRQMPTTA